MTEEKEYPCQQLLGGTGSAIYENVNGLCSHPECKPPQETMIEAEELRKRYEKETNKSPQTHAHSGWSGYYVEWLEAQLQKQMPSERELLIEFTDFAIKKIEILRNGIKTKEQFVDYYLKQ